MVAWHLAVNCEQAQGPTSHFAVLVCCKWGQYMFIARALASAYMLLVAPPHRV